MYGDLLVWSSPHRRSNLIRLVRHMYKSVFNSVTEIPQQLWAACPSGLTILMRKNFLLYSVRIFLFQLLLTVSLSVHLGAESLTLSSPLIGCLVFLRLNNLGCLILSFWVMNLQSSCRLSTGLVPIWNVVFLCGRDHNWTQYSRWGLTSVEHLESFTALRLLATAWLLCWEDSTHSTCTSAHFPWHCCLSNFYCSCGNFITDARLCTCLCRT